jgi:hypothetical protein
VLHEALPDDLAQADELPEFGLDTQPQVPNVLDAAPCARAAAPLRRVRPIWNVVDSRQYKATLKLCTARSTS